MKQIFSIMLVFCMLMGMFSAFAEEAPTITEQSITLIPGTDWQCPIETFSAWQSDDPEIVSASGSVFTAHKNGTAVLTALKKGGGLAVVTVTVDGTELPALIQDAIAYALNEWETVGMERLPRCNKYTLWYSNGNKYEYGWCAAFECYCLYHVGIPMVEWTACEPHPDDEVWSVKANGVGKVVEGFQKMGRLTFTPRPGYLIVYGKKNSGNSMHVGLITDVKELGEEKFLVYTVEGNMGNTVKRYCYVYDRKNADESRANERIKKKDNSDPYPYKVYDNYYAPDEQYQTDPNTFKYDKHEKDWYVFRICATWLCP